MSPGDICSHNNEILRERKEESFGTEPDAQNVLQGRDGVAAEAVPGQEPLIPRRKRFLTQMATVIVRSPNIHHAGSLETRA